MDKFEKSVKSGGLLIYDPSGITRMPERTDITVCSIDAIEVAAELGNAKVYNMAVLGAYLKTKPSLKMENVVKGLEKSIPSRYKDLIEKNREAIEKGMERVKILSGK